MKRLLSKLLKKIYLWNVQRKLSIRNATLKVNGWSSINGNTIIGEHVNFNGIKIHGYGKVQIGSYFHSGFDCLIISSSHNYRGEKIPYDEINIMKDVTIEDFVWIGSKVTIVGNVTIGEGAIVQAGSVVVSSIPKYAIAGGNPAKVFKYRDIEHFEYLKNLKKFH